MPGHSHRLPFTHSLKGLFGFPVGLQSLWIATLSHQHCADLELSYGNVPWIASLFAFFNNPLVQFCRLRQTTQVNQTLGSLRSGAICHPHGLLVPILPEEDK